MLVVRLITLTTSNLLRPNFPPFSSAFVPSIAGVFSLARMPPHGTRGPSPARVKSGVVFFPRFKDLIR